MIRQTLNLIELVDLLWDNTETTYVSIYGKPRDEGVFFQSISHLIHTKYLNEHAFDRVTSFRAQMSTYNHFQEREVSPFCELIVFTEPVTKEEEEAKKASYDAYDKECFKSGTWPRRV